MSKVQVGDAFYSYHFDSESRVGLTIEGVLNDEVLVEAFRTIYADPGYRPGMNELTDCSAVSHVTMTPEGVRALHQLMSEQPEPPASYRVGIVAPADPVFGMARMYELLLDNDSEVIQVFRHVEAAEQFTA